LKKYNPFADNRPKFTMGNSIFTLIIGDAHKPEIRKLVSVLEAYFPLAVAQHTAEGEVFRRSPEPDLMILTDTVHYEIHTLVRLKNHFPKARFLALFDRVEPEMEVALRCAGTLFLGSYESFYTVSQNIMETLVAAQGR